MRMRQSLAQFEAAFREETVEDRERGERLRREAAAEQIADNYQRFIKVYDEAEAGALSSQ